MEYRLCRFTSLFVSVVSATLCVSALTSCGAAPRYDLKLSPLHKDSVLLAVFLESPATVAIYQEIAVREMTHLLTHWESSPVPLYEVRFEFLSKQSPQTKYASIVAQVESDLIAAVRTGSNDLASYSRQWKTYLY